MRRIDPGALRIALPVALLLAGCFAVVRANMPNLDLQCSFVLSITPGSSVPDTCWVTALYRHIPPRGVSLRGAGVPGLRLIAPRVTQPGGLSADYELLGADAHDNVANGIHLKPTKAPFVEVSYGVVLGMPDGDEHMGLSGTCESTLSSDFFFAKAKDLFLLPDSSARVTRIRVGLSAPREWDSAAPWQSQRRHHWECGIGGRWVVEDLVSGFIAAGHMRSDAFSLDRTIVRVVTSSTVSPSDFQSGIRRLGQSMRYAEALAARGLGPDYLIAALPAFEGGEGVTPTSWATGQSLQLFPMTPFRFRDAAEGVLDALLRSEPFAVRAARPPEYWLVDAIIGLYSRRAVVAAGMISEQDVRLGLLQRLSERRGSHPIADVENYYRVKRPGATERKVVAPALLEWWERSWDDAHALSVPRAGEMLRKYLQNPRAASFWAQPGHRDGPFARTFREHYLKHGRPIPLEPGDTLSATLAASPIAGLGTIGDSLLLLITGNSHGFMEVCGCEASQSGGLARRASVLKRVRARRTPTLVLDAGSMFPKASDHEWRDPVEHRGAQCFLGIVGNLRYDAAALGSTEFMRGPSIAQEAVGLHPAVPFLCANVRSAGKEIASAVRVVERDGMRIGVIGLFEPPPWEVRGRELGDALVSLEIASIISTLDSLVPLVAPRVRLLVVLGRIGPATIRRIASRYAEINLIVSSDNEYPGISVGRVVRPTFQVSRQGWPQGDANRDAAGFLGKTLVVYSALAQYGVTTVPLRLNSDGHVLDFSVQDVELTESITDDPAVRLSLERCYRDMTSIAMAHKSTMLGPFADDPLRMAGGYVGVSACQTCHPNETQQWLTTGHARAFNTLLKNRRQSHPGCVPCHVVGYGSQDGFKIGDPPAALTGVQCEVCHGPGAKHLVDPTRNRLSKAVGPDICARCHTPDHSHDFKFHERLPMVTHHSRVEALGHSER